MNLENLLKLTLIHMAMHDGVELSLRYAAVREIQMRWSDDMITDLVLLYGKGEDEWRIAEVLGVTEVEVKERIKKHKIRRVSNGLNKAV